jgi:hypothetical protein
LTIHGVQPGPLIFAKHPEIPYSIYVALFLGMPIMVVIGLWGTRLWVRLTLIPTSVIAAIVAAVCLLGTYAEGGDLFSVHHFRRERPAAGVLVGLGLGQLFLDLGDLAIGDLGRATEVAVALGRRQFSAQAIERLAQLGPLTDLVLFGLPAGGQGVGFDLQVRDLVVEFLQAQFRRDVGLLLQGLALDLQLDQAAVDLVEFFRFRLHGHAQARRRIGLAERFGHADVHGDAIKHRLAQRKRDAVVLGDAQRYAERI